MQLFLLQTDRSVQHFAGPDKHIRQPVLQMPRRLQQKLLLRDPISLHSIGRYHPDSFIRRIWLISSMRWKSDSLQVHGNFYNRYGDNEPVHFVRFILLDTEILQQSWKYSLDTHVSAYRVECIV